ncbi:MAG: signal peptidase I [Acidimicrobiales bacterium]
MEETGARREGDGRRRIPLLVELPLLVVAALCLTLVVKAHVAQAFSIPSESMEPQLQVGDRVVVSRTAYRLHEVRRGDIVVFRSAAAALDDDGFLERTAKDLLETVALRAPGDDELIKRVVGLSGESIEARDGVVVIDGRQLIEPYLPAGVTTGDFGPVTVPEGHVFVLGDNRGNSQDSRFAALGPVPEDRIVGRAVARVWPPGRTAFL